MPTLPSRARRSPMPAESCLQLHRPAPAQGQGAVDSSNQSQTPRPATSDDPEPLQVPAKVACKLAGVSLATWHRLHSAGKVPAPVRLGGRVLWRLDELKSWIGHGCPDRRAWEALRSTSAGKRVY